MSEQDEAAIRIVEKLQSRIQKTVIALASIFALAILGAMFWAGQTDRQVDNNTKNINDLTVIVRDFVSSQKVQNEHIVTDEDLEDIKKLLTETSNNLKHLSFWAEAKGYKGLPRNGKKGDD